MNTCDNCGKKLKIDQIGLCDKCDKEFIIEGLMKLELKLSIYNNLTKEKLGVITADSSLNCTSHNYKFIPSGIPIEKAQLSLIEKQMEFMRDNLIISRK